MATPPSNASGTPPSNASGTPPSNASGTPPSNTSGTPLPLRPPPPKRNIQTEQFHVTPPSVKKHFEQLQPLGVEKVRWFYREDKKWTPFIGADSLEIEKTFRSLPEALQSPLLIPKEVDQTKIKLPIVRGQLYEVNILDRECGPIYFKEKPVPIRRGTWFKGPVSGSWEPLSENDAANIEEGHIQVIRSMGLGSSVMESSISSQNVIHHIKLGVNRIDWQDIGEVYMTNESTGSRIAQKIGLSGATPLHRGYEKDALVTDCYGVINHIVFLVHGMGQLYHGDGGIVQSRKKFAEVAEKSRKKFFKHKDGDASRVEFFPIEWRSKLRLDEGIIDIITPENLGSLRRVINDTTLDVFYYTSPFYREEIIQALRNQLNSIYRQYCQRNPSFVKNGGKVSIIAHSLGSVIIYDVLTLWNSYLAGNDKFADANVAGGSEQRWSSWFWGFGKQKEATPTSSLPGKTHDELRKQLYEARLNMAKIEAQLYNNTQVVNEDADYSLDFNVEYVFNIGSPLGVFLVMRGIRPREDVEQHILPTSVCKRIFNVYDPADPVAYRLEPIIYDYYARVPPVRLAHVGPALEPRKSISGQPQGIEWLKSLFGSKASASKNSAIEYQVNCNAEVLKSQQENILEGKKVLKHRIDYVLEQSMIEYFSAITSHQAYWYNIDFAKFVLQTIFSSEPVNTKEDNANDEVIDELERRNSQL